MLSEISQMEKDEDHVISPVLFISVPLYMAFPFLKTTQPSYPTLPRKLLFKL